MNNIKISNIFIKILLTMGFFLISQVALGQESSGNVGTISSVLSGSVVKNDVSITILSTLFGGLPIFGGGEDALHNVFRIFNICVLTMGGVLSAYTLLMGIVGTATSGEALGKYNTTMTPLRTAAGVALILPVANGYALIQVIIMWLVVQGIMIADIVWSGFVSSGSLSSSLAISPIQPESKMLAKNILLSSMCMAAIQRESDTNGEGLNMGWTNGTGSKRKVIGLGSLKEIVKTKEETIKLTAGEMAGRNGIPPNACGEITINKLDIDDAWHKGIDKSSKTVEITDAVTGVKMGGFSGIIMAGYSLFRVAMDSAKERTEYKKWLQTLSVEQAVATESLIIEAGAIADAIVNQADNDAAKVYNEAENRLKNVTKELDKLSIENNDGLNSTLDGINDNNKDPAQMKIIETMSEEEVLQRIHKLASIYQTSLREKSIRTYKNGNVYDGLVQNANSYGWALAGTFFVQMGGMSDAVNQILLNMPTAVSSMENPKNFKINSEINGKYMAKLKYYYSLDEDLKEYGREISVIDKSENKKDGFADSGANVTVLFDKLLKGAINISISDNEHPIMQLKRMGSLMLSAVGPIMTHMFQTVKNSNGGGVLLSLIAYTLIGVLLTGGITLTYVLPMLPTLVWLGMLFGWLVMVFEAMIASPLWIVMHLSPAQSDDFVGSQKNGYMLVLSLISRPVLMVIGFICAVVTITVLGYFINTVFVFLYAMTQFGTTGFVASLLSLIVVPLMYAGIVYIALKEVINIMYKVPDELLGWFGGGGPQLGGYGSAMGNNSVQVFGMMASIGNQPVTAISQQASGKRAEANRMLQSKGNYSDKKKGLEDSIFGNSSQSPYGAASAAENNGGGLSSNINDKSIDSIAKLQGSSKLEDSAAGNEHIKNMVNPTGDPDILNNAISSVSSDIAASGEEGVKSDDFVRRVNDKMAESTYGKENAQKLGDVRDMLNKVSPSRGDNAMKELSKKTMSLAQGTGMPYTEAGRIVGDNATSQINAFMHDKDAHGFDADAFTSDNLPSKDQPRTKLSGAVGKIGNALRGMTHGENRNTQYGMNYDPVEKSFSNTSNLVPDDYDFEPPM